MPLNGNDIFLILLGVITSLGVFIMLAWFWDLTLGRIIDSIKNREPRKIFLKDRREIGFLADLLMFPVYYWIFDCFTRKKKIAVIVCSLILGIIFWRFKIEQEQQSALRRLQATDAGVGRILDEVELLCPTGRGIMRE